MRSKDFSAEVLKIYFRGIIMALSLDEQVLLPYNVSVFYLGIIFFTEVFIYGRKDCDQQDHAR